MLVHIFVKGISFLFYYRRVYISYSLNPIIKAVFFQNVHNDKGDGGFITKNLREKETKDKK